MQTLVGDLRYAVRLLRKAPAFTSVVVLTLTLGIGANAAIFSVVDALLLKPLPYREASELVMAWQDLRARGGPAHEWTGPANQFDWMSATDALSGVATVRGWAATITGADIADSEIGEQVTHQYFDVLGARPELGRDFREADDVPNAARVVVLSHALWVSRFGSDRSAVGRIITISGEPHEIIGVMPSAFRPIFSRNAALWRPLRWNPVNAPREMAIAYTVARMAPGASLAQAQTAMNALARRLQQEHPETDAGKGIALVPLLDQQVGDLRLGLFVLLGAVGFVLLIACVNVANLLLARSTGRERELAVRRALGADRGRLTRQLLTESVLLASLGGIGGALVGGWGVEALKKVAPAGTPRLDEVAMDARVLAFTAVLALATGLLFGLFPAWRVSRETLSPALKAGARGQLGDGGNRPRRVLIVAELALALMLLVGAGLLVRTFIALQRADLGFNPDRVLAGFVLPTPAKYKTPEQRAAFYNRLLERTAAIPGVTQAALSSVVPLGGDNDMDFAIVGRPAPASGRALTVWYRIVSANYLSTLGIPLKAGHAFAAGEPQPVILINETMARHYWPTGDALGQRLTFGGDSRVFSVIGITGDVLIRGPRAEQRDELYVPYWQQPELGTNVVLKTSLDPNAFIEPLRRAVTEIDPGVAVAGAESMADAVASANGPSRFYASLVAGFAGLALLLAAVGIYGVLSYAVSQRTQEIGVRLALGAGRGEIFRLIVGDSLSLAAAGLVIGGGGAIAVGRVLGRLLYGVGAIDGLTFGLTAAALLGVAVVASYVPARRAMQVHPVEALRSE